MILDFTEADALIDSFKFLDDRMATQKELDQTIHKIEDGIIYCVALSLIKELEDPS